MTAGLDEADAIARTFGQQEPGARRYAELLCSTGLSHGLIGPREAPRIWERHILPSALIGELVPADATVVDVGSGAGLPGIPLQLARPDLSVALVEPMARRVAFLQQCCDVLELAATTVIRARADGLARRTWDVAVVRAVAPLPRLIPMALPLVGRKGMIIAVKGDAVAAEIEEARRQLSSARVAPWTAAVQRLSDGPAAVTAAVITYQRTTA